MTNERDDGFYMDNYRKYLLILPCSKVKKNLKNAPSIDVYDGPFYRMIRRNKPKNLDIEIVSANYGLINSNDLISYYDQIMTIKRAKELANSIKLKLEMILKKTYYTEIFVNLGKIYMVALEESEDILIRHNVYWTSGQIGERLHQLKNWLESIDAEAEEA